jgi:pyruvate formate-lyase/glycerol dehydratase family glycyl radical enzyme
MIGRMGDIFYDNERLINMLKAGLILPEWKDKKKERGVGGGYAQSGLGLGPSLALLCVEYDKFIKLGADELIRQAETERGKIRFTYQESVDKYRYYTAVAISFRAINTLGERYANLAAEKTAKEQNPGRRAELEEIEKVCRWVPAKPARTFREALQAYWFLVLMLSPSTTLPGGRFDQYMYPYYKKDLEEGRITREEAIELICLLRLKDMELNRTSGSNLRKKNAGMAKWHNYTIGGTDPITGEDSTNDLTYMLIDAAMITKTPHFTLTLRVHEKTPEALMKKALESVRMGLGMPAFVSEKSYMATFTLRGVPVAYARDFVMTGCLDGNLPGKSRTVPVAMVTFPLIFDIFRHNGVDVKTGLHCGIETGDFTSYRTYDELFAAFRQQAEYLLSLVAEKNNVEMFVTQELLGDPLRSALMFEGIESGTELHKRVLPFENNSVFNPIGMINLGDSLAAINKLVFDEKKYTLKQLNDALEADWTGYEEMRKDFLSAPKYGNDDDYVDKIVADCYRMLCEIADTMTNLLGKPQISTGISITSHQPGGALTGATPDGRKAHEILADGTTSPMHGCDTHGPTAVFKSAMKINQDPLQATLMNMKFHPSALKTDADLAKLGSMIKVYLTNGGKQVQFNVVDQQTLRNAKEKPDQYRDLIIRVAGYSTYFALLSNTMQDEVINRTSQDLY